MTNEATTCRLLGLSDRFCFIAMTPCQDHRILLSNGLIFYLQRDRDEYDSIAKERVELETIIDSTAAEVEALAEACVDHGLRRQLFESIGQYYSTRFFMNLLVSRGGRIRARVFNLRFVRRWNLTYFLYDRESRKAIRQAKRRCVEYFDRAIAEFETAGASVDVGRACYNCCETDASESLCSS